MLLPLLAVYVLDKHQLPIVIVPEALLPQVKRSLSLSLTSINKQLCVFSTQRNDPSMEAKWNEIDHGFKMNNTVILTTPSDLHCLRLNYILDPKTSCRNVLSLFSEKGFAITDEIDSVLDMHHNVQFSTGSTYSPPSHELKPLIALITHDFFKRPSTSLVDLLMNRLEIDDALKDTVNEFLRDSNSNIDLSSFNEQLQDILYMLRYQLHFLFKETKKLRYNIDYGKLDAAVESVPYLYNNIPCEKSRFDNVHELLNLTVLMYLNLAKKNQFPAWIINQYVSEVLTAQEEELTTGKTSKVMTEFRDIFGHPEAMQDLHAFVQKSLKHHPESDEEIPLEKFLRSYILPKICLDEESIQSNPIDLSYMFNYHTGFAGTFWNEAAWPIMFDNKSVKEVDGRTLYMMYQKANIRSLNSQESIIGELIEAINTDPDRSLCAFIDSGGILEGQTNESVAKQLLKKIHFDDIIYYKNNTAVILSKSGHGFVEKAFERSDARIESRFTYYDHSHTTGADIKQPKEGKAILTCGKRTPLRDLLQGACRMRGFHLNQSIDIWCSVDVDQGVSTIQQLLSVVFKHQTENLHENLVSSVEYQAKRIDPLKQGMSKSELIEAGVWVKRNKDSRSLLKSLPQEVQSTSYLKSLGGDDSLVSHYSPLFPEKVLVPVFEVGRTSRTQAKTKSLTKTKAITRRLRDNLTLSEKRSFWNWSPRDLKVFIELKFKNQNIFRSDNILLPAEINANYYKKSRFRFVMVMEGDKKPSIILLDDIDPSEIMKDSDQRLKFLKYHRYLHLSLYCFSTDYKAINCFFSTKDTMSSWESLDPDKELFTHLCVLNHTIKQLEDEPLKNWIGDCNVRKRYIENLK